MSRFAFFGIESASRSGGMGDFRSCHDTLDEAVAACDEWVATHQYMDTCRVEIVDLHKLTPGASGHEATVRREVHKFRGQDGVYRMPPEWYAGRTAAAQAEDSQ